MSHKEKQKALRKEKKQQLLARKICFSSWAKGISKKLKMFNIKQKEESKAVK
jgi:hypothetical protein